MFLWQSREQAELAAEKIKAFSQPQRLMILSRLLDGERSVTEIDATTRIGQPALSQQLAQLRRVGLVTTRRQAKLVYYSLADEEAAACVRTIEGMFGGGVPSQALVTAAKLSTPNVASEQSRSAARFAKMIES